MVEMWPNGASSQHLRWNLWVRSFEIYHQSGINEANGGEGMVGIEIKIPYKLQVDVQWKTLGILRIELLRSQAPMNHEFFEALIANLAFEKLPQATQELLNSIISAPTEAMDTEAVTIEEVVPEFVREAEEVAP